jgi:hypothetical protein
VGKNGTPFLSLFAIAPLSGIHTPRAVYQDEDYSAFSSCRSDQVRKNRNAGVNFLRPITGHLN